MEWIDIVLYLLYFIFFAAIAVALWSYVRRRLRSTGRGVVQNGIKRRLLDSCVWLFVLLVAILAAVCSGGDLVSVMLITMLVLLLTALLAVGWSMIKGR